MGTSSRLTPGPVSWTASRRRPGAGSVTSTRTDPSAVNLMALPTKLMRICRIRSGSATIRRSGASIPNSSPFARARGPIVAETVSSTSRRSNSDGSARASPASSFEKSRMSLITSSSRSPDLRITDRWSA